MAWFSKSKKLLEGFHLISKISDIEFQDTLEKVEICRKEEEESSLEAIDVPIEGLNKDQILLLVKTIFYILQKLNLFIIKPTKIQEDLKNVGLPENKIDLLLKYYRNQNKDIVDSLGTRHDGINDITWKLKTILSTETQQKVQPPMPIVELELHSSKQVLSLELNHENLLELYENLECIQQELDVWSKN